VFEEIAGVDCYVAGSKENVRAVIFSFSDVFACLMERKRQVADEIAAAIPGSVVITPDYFRGNPIIVPPTKNTGIFGQLLAFLSSMPSILWRIRYTHNWISLGPLLHGLVRL
jgi:hypothetical protein